MHFADLQIIRPIPEGRSMVGTIAARFGRLALLYVGIALAGVAATFVLALIGLERTVIGVLGAIIGVSVILGIIHNVTMSVRMLRFTVRLADSELAVLRQIAELATWRLGGGEHARLEHQLPDVSEIRERVPRPDGAGRTPDLEFHTETVHYRGPWITRSVTVVVLAIFFALEIVHMLDFITAHLPGLPIFVAGLGAGAGIGVIFAIVIALMARLTRGLGTQRK